MEPVLVDGLRSKNVVDIACGAKHTLALTSLYSLPLSQLSLSLLSALQATYTSTSESGEVYSWGWNYTGQLGHGDVSDHFHPRLIKNLTIIKGTTTTTIALIFELRGITLNSIQR